MFFQLCCHRYLTISSDDHKTSGEQGSQHFKQIPNVCVKEQKQQQKYVGQCAALPSCKVIALLIYCNQNLPLQNSGFKKAHLAVLVCSKIKKS